MWEVRGRRATTKRKTGGRTWLRSRRCTAVRRTRRSTNRGRCRSGLVQAGVVEHILEVRVAIGTLPVASAARSRGSDGLERPECLRGGADSGAEGFDGLGDSVERA
jgi:hypothetical protein